MNSSPCIRLFSRLDLHEDFQKGLNSLSESISAIQALQEEGTAAVLVRSMILALHLHFERDVRGAKCKAMDMIIRSLTTEDMGKCFIRVFLCWIGDGSVSQLKPRLAQGPVCVKPKGLSPGRQHETS